METQIELQKIKKVIPTVAFIIALSLIFLDSSMLSPALPEMQKDLHLSIYFLRWIFNIYFLLAASFVIIGGKIADKIGYRKMLLIGLGISTVASTVAASCSSGYCLLFARGLQGLAVACLGPSATSILLSTFPAKERGRALGTGVGISSIFFACGPFIGGFLTQFFSWHAIYIVLIPFSLFGMLIVFNINGEEVKSDQKIDWLSALLLPLIIGLMILMIMNPQKWSVDAPFVLFCVSALLFLSFCFYLRYKKTDHPLIDFSLLRKKTFRLGIFHLMIGQFVIINTVFWLVFFNTTFHYTPLHVGMLSLFCDLPTIFISPMVGYISDRKGYEFPMILGHALVLIGYASITFFVYQQKPNLMFIALFVTGCGISAIITSISTFTYREIPSFQNGMASGIYNTVRFGSSSLAIAILGSTKSLIRNTRMEELIQTFPSIKHFTTKEIYLIFEGKEELKIHSDQIADNILLLLKQGYVSVSIEGFRFLNMIVSAFIFFSLFISIRYFKSIKANKNRFVKNN